MEIKNIRKIKLDTPIKVYDIEVEDDHTFVCNGVVVHNSGICRYRDSKVWFYDPKDNEKTSLPLLPGAVTPPAHYRCRSTITYITRSWEELGIDLQEAPEGTRSSLNGYVPAKTTYYEWLETQSEKIQKDVLGKTRFDLWKAGEAKPYQFYSQDGRWLTLKELNKKL